MFPDLTRDDVFRIETRRLWLRWPTAKDAPAIVKLAGERTVADTTARIPHPLDRHAVDTFLLNARGANSAGTGLTLALAQRAAPASLIGMVEISGDGGAPHLGYWLGRPWWGDGLMGEAARAVVHAFFAYAGGQRLEAFALPANPASRRVLETVGFRSTGRGRQPCPARGGDREVDRFDLDRTDWAAHGAAGETAAELAAAP